MKCNVNYYLKFYFVLQALSFNFLEEVILAEERTTEEERMHIIEGMNLSVSM